MTVVSDSSRQEFRGKGIAMSYTPAVAAALSGATLRQLSHWRRGPEPVLAPAQARTGGRVFYSFRDVVALRAIVYLRGKNVPLQRFRKALVALRAMGETDHLSSYEFVAIGKDIVWRESAEQATALTGEPGQRVIAQMVNILASFTDAKGNTVSPLARPEPGVEVDREVRSGFPVIEGTRVPYDLVASLLADGMAAEKISEIYPSVTAQAAKGALAFASRVDGNKQRARVA